MVRVALAQVDSRLGDLEANIARAGEVLGRAIGAGAELVVFPELHLTGYSIGEIDHDPALHPDDPRLTELAGRAGAAGVVLGFVEVDRHNLRRYNAAAYYEGGRLVHVHRKLYLPTYADFEELKHFSPGPSMRAFETSRGRVAVLICNDAWQPQVPFVATQDGARILLVPAASVESLFPERYDSRDYWRGITRFYGRMLQLFVVFVNRVGSEPGLTFWGGSHAVDPWGEVLAEAGDDEEVLTVDLDLAAVRERRFQVPLVKEARLGWLRREVDRLLQGGDDDL